MSEHKESESDFILDALMARRTVVLRGKICSESVDSVGKRLLTLQARSNDPINLIIDSGGGHTEAALSLCDLIGTLLTAPVKGVVFGRCGSAATFVLLHCTERLGARYSHYFIHSGMRNEISLPINQVTSSDDLEHLLKEVRAMEERVMRLYMERLTPPVWHTSNPTTDDKREFVRNLILRGDQRFNESMSAEEAIEAGLITGIIDRKLGIFTE